MATTPGQTAAPTIPHPNTSSHLINFLGTPSEVCRHIGEILGNPELQALAPTLRGDYDIELRGETTRQALERLASWPATADAAHRALAALGKQIDQPLPVEEPEDPRYALARERFADFTQLMWPAFELRPITKYLIAEFERAVLSWERGEKVKVLLTVPPRCGKTELFSRHGSPWIVGRNPERALLALSMNQSFASDIGDSVLDIIVSEEYAGTFPGVKLAKRSRSKKDFKIDSDDVPANVQARESVDQAREKALLAGALPDGSQAHAELVAAGRHKKGRYVSYGIGTKFTGRDADGLLCDDLVDEREADKETAMLKAHRAVRAIRNRLNPKGKWFFFIVMTRDNDNDVAAFVQRELSGDGDWRVIEVPLIADADTTIEVPHTPSGFGGPWFRPAGDVLEPYTSEEAYARKDFMLRTAPHEWYSRYQCKPVAAKGNMIDPADLKPYTVTPLTLDRRSYARVVISVDTGEGRSVTGARSAIGVYGEPFASRNACEACGGAVAHRGGCTVCRGSGCGPTVRLLELLAYPWQTPDQIKVLKAVAGRWRADQILIEAKSTGPGVAQSLWRDQHCWKCEGRDPAIQGCIECKGSGYWIRCPVQLEDVEGDKIVRMARALPYIRDGQYGVPASSLTVSSSWSGVGWVPGIDWVKELREEALNFPKGRFKDRCDQLSQYVNWRTLNPLPRTAGVGPVQGAMGRPAYGEQSRTVSRAVEGKPFAAF